MSVITKASATVTGADQFAEVSYVPPGAVVQLGFSGLNGHTVELQAKWDQTGAWETQKTWTADPSEAEQFKAPRACSLRLGVPAGGFGTGNVDVALGFDYPVR